MEPHDEFIELCAVSTSGELSEQERRKLEAHLAGCAECRQALQEFEAAVDIGVPFLASKLTAGLSVDPTEQFVSPRTNSEQPASLEPAPPPRKDANRSGVVPEAIERGFASLPRKRSRAHEGQLELRLASLRCVHSAHRRPGNLCLPNGHLSHSVASTQTISDAPDTRIEALEQQMSDAGHEREGLRLQLAQRDKVISDLRREMEMQSASLDEMKSAQANLEKSIQNDEGAKQQSTQDRAHSFASNSASRRLRSKKLKPSSIPCNARARRTSRVPKVWKRKSTIFMRSSATGNWPWASRRISWPMTETSGSC